MSAYRVVKQIVFWFLTVIRIDALARRLNRQKLVIVCYHGVVAESKDKAKSWLLVSLPKFERQLAYLRRHYDIRELDSAVRLLRGRALARPTASITFDDGYRNNYVNALPVLQRFNAPATVFVPTALIGSNQMIWTTEVEMLCDGARDTVEALKEQPVEQRDEQIRRLRAGRPAAAAPKEFQLMSWEEVAALESTKLIRIGAHTATHPIMATLPPEQLHEEIAGSIRTVAQRVAQPSNVFCYPNGRPRDFNSEAMRILKDAGCTAAVSTIDGLNEGDVEPYALKRISVGPDWSTAEFKLAVSGATGMLRKLFFSKQRIT